MSDFFAFLETFAICGTVFFVAMLVMLSLPKSQLRSVGLQCLKYALAAGLFILIPGPIDVLPDVVPGVGWLDDIGYLVGGIAAIKSANRDRRQRAFELECENAYMARMAGLEPKTEREKEVQRLLEEQEQTNGRS